MLDRQWAERLKFRVHRPFTPAMRREFSQAAHFLLRVQVDRGIAGYYAAMIALPKNKKGLQPKL